jgi:halimadienyl-diphosphate synthase
LDSGHPAIQKIRGFLRKTRTKDVYWADKWHASPYYATAHAIIACADFSKNIVPPAVEWILETQRSDGSWGYYDIPTAEETAYCLQALIFWKRLGGTVPQKALNSAVIWLKDHLEPPYPPLWIGKCLYCPEMVVKSAILSALMLAEQE